MYCVKLHTSYFTYVELNTQIKTLNPMCVLDWCWKFSLLNFLSLQRHHLRGFMLLGIFPFLRNDSGIRWLRYCCMYDCICISAYGIPSAHLRCYGCHLYGLLICEAVTCAYNYYVLLCVCVHASVITANCETKDEFLILCHAR